MDDASRHAGFDARLCYGDVLLSFRYFPSGLPRDAGLNPDVDHMRFAIFILNRLIFYCLQYDWGFFAYYDSYNLYSGYSDDEAVYETVVTEGTVGQATVDSSTNHTSNLSQHNWQIFTLKNGDFFSFFSF